MNFRQLDESDFAGIKSLFKTVFMAPPWCDDWSNDVQLTEYIRDLLGARSPLVYGLLDGSELVGCSIGNVRHWFGGTEYHIEEFFIRNERQHAGLGTEFLSLIEDDIKKKGVTNMFLMTERDKPAFSFYRKLGFNEIDGLVPLFKGL